MERNTVWCLVKLSESYRIDSHFLEDDQPSIHIFSFFHFFFAVDSLLYLGSDSSDQIGILFLIEWNSRPPSYDATLLSTALRADCQ